MSSSHDRPDACQTNSIYVWLFLQFSIPYEEVFKSSQTDQEALPKQISMFDHLRRFQEGSRADKFAATFRITK